MDWQLQQAARLLRGGGVVLHATEGVWGLACDPFNRRAVARILAMKQRAMAKGLILIGADAAMFQPELQSLSEAAAADVTSSWPGPVSWVLPNERFPIWITGGRDTVVVRVPGHAQARQLAACYGGPLVSTSANPSGQPAPCSIWRARTLMGGAVDLVLSGRTAGRDAPSAIRTPAGAVLRHG